jgi:hypothetical protein
MKLIQQGIDKSDEKCLKLASLQEELEKKKRRERGR